jgi:hypothetical protein
MATTSNYFLWGYLKNTMFQKNLHTIPKLKSTTQSQTEAMSAETETKVLNNSVLNLHKVHDLQGHHMENVIA